MNQEPHTLQGWEDVSNDYGLYDDGSHIFNLYDNFAGTKLNTSKWIPLDSNYALNNGITFTVGVNAVFAGGKIVKKNDLLKYRMFLINKKEFRKRSGSCFHPPRAPSGSARSA